MKINQFLQMFPLNIIYNISKRFETMTFKEIENSKQVFVGNNQLIFIQYLRSNHFLMYFCFVENNDLVNIVLCYTYAVHFLPRY